MVSSTMTAHDPLLGPLLGRSCPSCGLASRLVTDGEPADPARAALCLKCRGGFLPHESLVAVVGATGRLPPTLPGFQRSLLCPRCDQELHGVLVAGVAAHVCGDEHGAFFDAERLSLFRRLAAGAGPDVVAAGHVTHPPRIKRPGYLRVATEAPAASMRAAAHGTASWRAVAVVAALLALAYKLGA